MKKKYKDKIEDIFVRGLSKEIEEVSNNSDFYKIFWTEEERIKFQYERFWSTSMGKCAEKSSLICLESNGDKDIVHEKKLECEVDKKQMDAVYRHCLDLKQNRCKPDWKSDLKKVKSLKSGKLENNLVTYDIGFLRGRIRHVISLKSPKANLDQNRVAREDLMIGKIAHPRLQVHYGLWYKKIHLGIKEKIITGAIYSDIFEKIQKYF